MVYNYEELDNHSDDPDDNVADTTEEPERQDIDIEDSYKPPLTNIA